jgi:3-dehydroquinate synthetase
MMNLLQAVGVKKLPPGLLFSDLLDLMAKDKKSERGQYRFVLLKKCGKVLTGQKASKIELTKTWKLLNEWK